MKQWIRYAAPLLLGGCAAFEDPEFWQAMADATNQAAATLQSGQGTYVAPQPAPVPYSTGSTGYTPYSSGPQPAQPPASPGSGLGSSQVGAPPSLAPANPTASPGKPADPLYDGRQVDPQNALQCLHIVRREWPGRKYSHHLENRCNRPVNVLHGCLGKEPVRKDYPFRGVYHQYVGDTVWWLTNPGGITRPIGLMECNAAGGKLQYTGCYAPSEPYWAAPDLSRFVCLKPAPAFRRP
ncbi:MAG: hypothetical protein ACK4MJ_04280 [Hylemonella sp.]